MQENYNGLVLSSGAAGGYNLLGSLHSIYTKSNCLKHVHYYAGCSVGSAICLLLAVGYSPAEIFISLCTNDINKLFTHHINLSSITQEYGIVSSQAFKNYIQQLIIDKIGENPTFQILKEKYAKTFICNAWCLNRIDNKKIYFSPKTTPNTYCVDAVMCSCCLPFIFSKAEINGEYYVDGSLFDRCPSDYLKHYMEEELLPGYKILALNLNKKETEEKQCANIIEYMKEISMISLYNQETICSDDIVDCIEIENDFNELTIQINNKKRLDIFGLSCDRINKKFGWNEQKFWSCKKNK
jgi:predicted acylesterase/phospholipase RssA